MKPKFKTIKIIVINWTIFVLIASGVAHYLILNQLKETEVELEACVGKWEELDQRLENGGITIEPAD